MNKYLLFKALCHLPKAIYFNFHYLPFHQAIKMPILFFIKGKIGAYSRDCPTLWTSTSWDGFYRRKW